ncbi:MAG: hypothetical protein NT015_16260 [Alphaproteobacteria bacterium]|nr:hypothetical protein [Alphaproteobacteria bacterium]
MHRDAVTTPLLQKTREFETWLTDPARRAALVIAHPAHEIRVLHWLSSVRPHVYILTQGSRSGADSARREASELLIMAQGATIAKTWGGAWDRDLYDMLLDGKYETLLHWADELTADFIARAVDLVVADSWQHYNVAHDITYALARLAVQRARHALGRDITLLTYPVVPPTLAPGAPLAPAAANLRLPHAAVAAKIAALGLIPGIATETADINTAEGADAHMYEAFHNALPLAQLLQMPRQTPLYEVFGEDRVRAGIYTDVVRWPHLARACEALAQANSATAQAA